mmetsp:Transcript_4095/g.17144  ORF Transcript_4095/g.17144 Transcript_4095/m.17144 type:complete len:339 (-) Transcript_4095:1560-2576(-)
MPLGEGGSTEALSPAAAALPAAGCGCTSGSAGALEPRMAPNSEPRKDEEEAAEGGAAAAPAAVVAGAGDVCAPDASAAPGRAKAALSRSAELGWLAAGKVHGEVPTSVGESRLAAGSAAAPSASVVRGAADAAAAMDACIMYGEAEAHPVRSAQATELPGASAASALSMRMAMKNRRLGLASCGAIAAMSGVRPSPVGTMCRGAARQSAPHSVAQIRSTTTVKPGAGWHRRAVGASAGQAACSEAAVLKAASSRTGETRTWGGSAGPEDAPGTAASCSTATPLGSSSEGGGRAAGARGRAAARCLRSAEPSRKAAEGALARMSRPSSAPREPAADASA